MVTDDNGRMVCYRKRRRYEKWDLACYDKVRKKSGHCMYMFAIIGGNVITSVVLSVYLYAIDTNVVMSFDEIFRMGQK